jgi:hypothetical protein
MNPILSPRLGCLAIANGHRVSRQEAREGATRGGRCLDVIAKGNRTDVADGEVQSSHVKRHKQSRAFLSSAISEIIEKQSFYVLFLISSPKGQKTSVMRQDCTTIEPTD